MRVSLLNVRLTWSESPLRAWVGRPLGSWLRADTAVAQMATRVPLDGQHRTGIIIQWLDGERHIAQVAVRRFGAGSAFHPLSQVIREGLEEMAGRRCPWALDPVQYARFLDAQEPEARVRAARLLDHYVLR